MSKTFTSSTPVTTKLGKVSSLYAILVRTPAVLGRHQQGPGPLSQTYTSVHSLVSNPQQHSLGHGLLFLFCRRLPCTMLRTLPQASGSTPEGRYKAGSLQGNVYSVAQTPSNYGQSTSVAVVVFCIFSRLCCSCRSPGLVQHWTVPRALWRSQATLTSPQTCVQREPDILTPTWHRWKTDSRVGMACPCDKLAGNSLPRAFAGASIA